MDQAGWSSDFPTFRDARPDSVVGCLKRFVRDASVEQWRAWDESVPLLQDSVHHVLLRRDDARAYAAILEYQLPLEARRPDVVVLLTGPVVVIELKGKHEPSQRVCEWAYRVARTASMEPRSTARTSEQRRRT